MEVDQKKLTQLTKKEVKAFPTKMPYNPRPELFAKQIKKWCHLTGLKLKVQICYSPTEFHKYLLKKNSKFIEIEDLKKFFPHEKTPDDPTAAQTQVLYHHILDTVALAAYQREWHQSSPLVNPIRQLIIAAGRLNRNIFLGNIHRRAIMEKALDTAKDAPFKSKGHFQLLYQSMLDCGISNFCITKGEAYGTLYALPFPKVKLNNQNQLHCADGPAMVWPKGAKRYALNGVIVPKEIVMTPKEDLTPNMIFKIRNIESRRAAIEKMGIENLFNKSKTKKIDTWREYELYDIQTFKYIPDKTRPDMSLQEELEQFFSILKMKCPSKGKSYFLRVPPVIRSAREAATWINLGKDPERFQVEM